MNILTFFGRHLSRKEVREDTGAMSQLNSFGKIVLFMFNLIERLVQDIISMSNIRYIWIHIISIVYQSFGCLLNAKVFSQSILWMFIKCKIVLGEVGGDMVRS